LPLFASRFLASFLRPWHELFFTVVIPGKYNIKRPVITSCVSNFSSFVEPRVGRETGHRSPQRNTIHDVRPQGAAGRFEYCAAAIPRRAPPHHRPLFSSCPLRNLLQLHRASHHSLNRDSLYRASQNTGNWGILGWHRDWLSEHQLLAPCPVPADAAQASPPIGTVGSPTLARARQAQSLHAQTSWWAWVM
jgi:hypothetical protein